MLPASSHYSTSSKWAACRESKRLDKWQWGSDLSTEHLQQMSWARSSSKLSARKNSRAAKLIKTFPKEHGKTIIEIAINPVRWCTMESHDQEIHHCKVHVKQTRTRGYWRTDVSLQNASKCKPKHWKRVLNQGTHRKYQHFLSLHRAVSPGSISLEWHRLRRMNHEV